MDVISPICASIACMARWGALLGQGGENGAWRPGIAAAIAKASGESGHPVPGPSRQVRATRRAAERGRAGRLTGRGFYSVPKNAPD